MKLSLSFSNTHLKYRSDSELDKILTFPTFLTSTSAMDLSPRTAWAQAEAAHSQMKASTAAIIRSYLG